MNINEQDKINNSDKNIIRSIRFRENNNTFQDKNIKTIQDNLIYFKNDILKDIKNTENRLNQKYDIQYNGFENRLQEMEKISANLNQKLSILTETISNENIIKEKLSFLESFKLKAEEVLISHDLRIKSNNKDLYEALLKYDKILLESILYPGVIGKNTQFQTFHDLIDYLLLNVNKLISSREKDNLENRESKNRIEELIKNFQGKFDFYLNNATQFRNQIIKNTEQEINNKIDNINKELSDNIFVINERMNNNDGKINDLSNNVMKSIEESNNELNIKIAKEIIDINSKMQKIENKYNDCFNEINLIKKEVKNIKFVITELTSKSNNILDKIHDNELMYNKRNNNINNIIKNSINNKIFDNKNYNTELFFNNNNFNTDFTTNKNNKKPKINEDDINTKENDNSNSIIKPYTEGFIKFDLINNANIGKSISSSISQNIKKIHKYKINNKQEDLKDNNNNNNPLYSKLFFNHKKNKTKKGEDILENEESNEKKNSISEINKHKNINENSLNQISNVMIKTKNILKKGNFQDINASEHKYFGSKNLKLNQNKKMDNYDKFLNEDPTNAKIKKVDLTIPKEMSNNSENNIFNINYNNNIDNDFQLINTIKNIKNETKKIYRKNKIINDFMIKNELYESKKVQTPKIFQKINSFYDLPLKNSNFIINDERALSDRQNSLNIRDNLSKQNNNNNKNIFKKLENKNKFLDKNKFKRLFSSVGNNNIKSNFNKIDVNFEDTLFNEDKEKEKIANNIEQIKSVLSLDQKGVFLERMKILGYSRENKIRNKNNNDLSYKKELVKYQLDKINDIGDLDNTNIEKNRIVKNSLDNRYE